MKKIYARYLLFLFIAFLATPTLVKMLDKNADVSIVYNFAEEEKSETSVNASVDFVLISHSSLDYSGFDSESHSIVDNYSFIIKSYQISIVSPPPDAVI